MTSTQSDAGPSHGPLHVQEACEGLPSYGDKPTILPADFSVPSSLDRNSVFFQVLAAPFKAPLEQPPLPRWKPPQEHKDKCRAMVQFATLPKDEDASSDNTRRTPEVDQLLYKPHGRWAWSAGLPIDDPKSLLSLRSEFSFSTASLPKVLIAL